MSTTCNRTLTVGLFAALIALQSSPAFAQFATQSAASATNWVVQVITPLVALAFAIVGILCLTGRIHWNWFLGAIVGIALFFGRDQIVDLIRGWVGA